MKCGIIRRGSALNTVFLAKKRRKSGCFALATGRTDSGQTNCGLDAAQQGSDGDQSWYKS